MKLEMNQDKRPDWTEYFMGIVFMAAKRSSCKEHQVGAILVRDRNLLATGYNGSPAGTVNCLRKGCLKMHRGNQGAVGSCRGINAEMNAVLQAAKHGTNIDGATLYVTRAPSYESAKMLINAGIEKIIYLNGEMNPAVSEILSESGITVIPYLQYKDLNGNGR